MQQCPNFIKREQTFDKTPKCENYSEYLYKSQTKFQCHSLFPFCFIRPPMATSVPLFISLCCFAGSDKSGTNN